MKPRKFYMDLDPDDDEAIRPGDAMIGPRVVLLVLDAHPTDSDAPNRWTLTVRSLGPRPTSYVDWMKMRAHLRDHAREIHYRPWRS